jgi:hypothetical protein
MQNRLATMKYFMPQFSNFCYASMTATVLVFVTKLQNKVMGKAVGRDSSVGIATRYELDGLGSNPGGDEIFRTRPDRPWSPPSLLYNGYRVIPGVKRKGRGVDHPPPSNAEVKERVGIYLYSPSGPLWPVLG